MKKQIIFLTFILILLSCDLPPKQKAISVLQEGIKDESAVIRVSAAKGLKQIRDTEGVKTFYEILQGGDKNGIAAALTTLYDLGENTYSPLIAKFTEHSDPLIQTEAYKIISIIDDERCRDILIRGTGNKIAKIRKVSYLGLEKFKEKRVIMNGLRDVDPLVRIAAAKVLGNMGKEGMENFIRKQMGTVTIEIWRQGFIALAEMGDTSAIPYIRDSLANAAEVPMELRLGAAEALLILNNKEGIDVLKEGLSSNNPFIRVKTVQILKKHRVPEGPQLLEEAVQDEYINVSIVAIEALAKYRNKKNQNLFQKLMDAPNPLVKIAAASAYLQNE